VRFGASLGVLLLGLEASSPLALEAVADPAAERGAEHESDRPPRGRTDDRTAAETDRLVLRGAGFFLGPPRRRRRARRGQYQEMLQVHGSLLHSQCALPALERYSNVGGSRPGGGMGPADERLCRNMTRRRAA